MKRLYPLLLIILVFIVWYYRQQSAPQQIMIQGETMGTTYSVKYLMMEPQDFKDEIDSILLDFNNSLSTYIPDSEISRFNNDSVLVFETPYFPAILEESSLVYSKTDGAFDPTVMPLVNFWGFGPDKSKKDFDSKKMIVDSILNYVGYNLIQYDNSRITKEKNGVELDFSAIAKGYGVDVVSSFIANKGIKDYFVEIGGEVRASGTNKEGVTWRVGIEDPTSSLSERSTTAIVSLENKSMATSGNYRNYYIEDGIKYAHTIDPKTGFPVAHSLLSVSVFAENCITADAYATAFMVMGKDKALSLSESLGNIEVFLIYDSGDSTLSTYSSPGIKDLIVHTK